MRRLNLSVQTLEGKQFSLLFNSVIYGAVASAVAPMDRMTLEWINNF
jgi:hypothetical protein